MAGGFIQLLATGGEKEYFNDVPHVSFFKSYFRRHTNFFINSFEIYSNYYQNNEVNIFKISKAGDLLSKGYLKFTFNENYIELLNNYLNMASTLTFDITQLLDSYNVFTNDFDKYLIVTIQTVKFIFLNQTLNLNYLNFMNTYLPNYLNIIYKIKFDTNITLQQDPTNTYYNINQPYDYYGFIYSIDYSNLLSTINESTNILNLLTENINYSTLRYFRLDLQNLNIAFKLVFGNYSLYQTLLNLCLSSIDMTVESSIIRINQYDIYISMKFNLDNSQSIDSLIEIVNFIKLQFTDYSILKARYYNNKIKYSDIVIKKNEIATFVNSMFGKKYNAIQQNNLNSKIVSDTYLYYNITFPLYSATQSNTLDLNYVQIEIFNLKESIIFGNLDTSDFNGTLIKNETTLINTANINNPYSVSLFTYIKLLIELFIGKNRDPTIQEFLSVVNSPDKVINYFYTCYTKNIHKFNKIILDILIHNNVCMLNNPSIRSILYQNSSFEHYNTTVNQFVSKKISTYEKSIINKYIFENIISNINTNYYCSFDMNRILVKTIIMANYVSLNSGEISILNYNYNNISNYENNNNVFELINYNYLLNTKTNQITSLFEVVEAIYRNLESFLYYVIYFSRLLINSNSSIKNIYNKNSNVIYFNSGLTQQVVNENPLFNTIFPISSSFFFYTQNQISNSNNKNNYNLFFNKDLHNYIFTIKNSMYQMYVANYQKYNFNLLNSPNNFSQTFDFFNNLYFKTIIEKYYFQIENYSNSLDYSVINNYFTQINYNWSKTIYNCTIGIDEILMLNLFKYIDLSLFNSSFSCYEITYPKTNVFYFTTETMNNYLKFIFTPGTPYYRIYYLYNFLCSMSLDKDLTSVMPNDLIQLRDLLLKLLVQFLTLSYPSGNTSNIFLETNYTFNNYNLAIFFGFNVFINNSFMSWDDINVLSNDSIKNLFSNSGLLKEIFIYCPFYFCKNNINLVQSGALTTDNNFSGIFSSGGFNILNLLSNIYNNTKFNFDDTVINALIITLKYNQDFFININQIINFVSTFFNKNDNNYLGVVDSLKSILSSDDQYNNKYYKYDGSVLYSNTFYSNCYVSAYSIGTLFDNTNALIVSTINTVYGMTNQLVSIDMFSLFYKNKTFDIKQWENILSSEQLAQGFIYYKNLLFQIDTSFGSNVLQYLQNIINGITKYIFDNFSYLINYLVSESVFINLLLTIDSYVGLYNQKNNSNIDLYNYFNTLFNIDVKITGNKFQTNSIIVIYLLYLLFISTCLSYDVINFSQLNSGQVYTFDTYIKSLYTENIYLNCLENFILILNSSTEILTFNYATIYVQNIVNGLNTSEKVTLNFNDYIQPDLFSIIFTPLVKPNNVNYFENKLSNYNFQSIDYINLLGKVFIPQFNVSDIVTWFQLDINISPAFSSEYLAIKQLSFNTPFYSRYSDTINSILTQNEKLLFTVNNKYFVNFVSTDKFISDDLFVSYSDYVDTNYNSTLSIIQDVYSNLKLSFRANGLNYYAEYQNLLINQIFSIIEKYYSTELGQTNTWTYTLLFSKSKKIINKAQTINQISNSDNLYDVSKYSPVVQDFSAFRDYVIRYLNSRIMSSINIERNVNRFIYNYLNEYVLKTNRYSENMQKFMNENTLYSYVKLYSNIYSQSNTITYESNLSLYQNDIVFEILNFLNYTDKKCFTQNPIFNDFLIGFSLDSTEPNSFYVNFQRFINFLTTNNYSDMFNKFILKNSVNVIDYFMDLFNLDEFHEYIYNFINLTESFSPITIYSEIIKFVGSGFTNLNTKLSIDSDNIMKKIVIYLFVIYLINANLFNIINSNIDSKIKRNSTLEYNFPNGQIKVNLNNVFDETFYYKLKKYIYYITVFDPNYPSIYQHNANIETNDFNNASFFYDVKSNTNAKDFINLCFKYVSSYEETIGYANTDITSLIVQTAPLNCTISKLVQSYNVMINIDQSNNNANKYYLTNASIIILSMYYNTIITDINSEVNLISSSTQFAFNNEKYYSHTQVKNVNVLFILLIYLLNKFNINYSNLNNQIDNIIANFRIGTFNLSEIFEELKGYTSNDYIKNLTINFTQTKNLMGLKSNLETTFISNTLSRSENITDLSILVSDTNNYSNIMPIDYDYDVIFFNMGNVYEKSIDIYKKYYSSHYNFYKFKYNYNVIYLSKAKYYKNVMDSDYALLNIKNYDVNLFNKIFIDIIYTNFSIPYFGYSGDNSIFTESFNSMIKMYMKYYFNFKSSNQLSSVENLVINNTFKTKANGLIPLNQIGYFINELYYYELYSVPLTTLNTSSVKDNFKLFIQQMEQQGNYNFEYTGYDYNYVVYVENLITLGAWYINTKFNIKLTTLLLVIPSIVLELINEISSYSNISDYFSNYYLYYKSSTTPFIYENIVFTINYSDFVNRFSKVIQGLIYCKDNISFTVNLNNLYELYFKNITFYYKKYVENNSIILPYTINLNQLQQYTHSYLIYVLTNNQKYSTDKFNCKIYLIFERAINIMCSGVKLPVLSLLYKWYFNKEIVFNTEIDAVNTLSLELYKILNTNYYGMVYSFYNEYYFSNNLSLKILLLNYTTMIINNPDLSIDYIYSTSTKLEILFRLKIFSIMITNISDSVFQNYFLFVLTNCYKYVYNEDIFYCVNLTNDVCTYLDYINKNIIGNNLISGYYKQIQNSTIHQIVQYKINKFYNRETNTDFLSNIYNLITTNLLQTNETSIIYVFVENSIYNILSQYGSVVYNYSILKSDIQYIEQIFDLIIEKIADYLTIIKLIFGGTNKNDTGIRVSVNQLINIFSNKTTYKYDNSIITIFTLIYDNFNNLGIERINYNMLVILFYYVCMIIYILNKWDKVFNEYLFSNGETFIYELINYINIQIYNYINLIEPVSTNKFFDGLNELLFNVYDNQTFTNKIIQFFDSILNISQIYANETFTKIQEAISLRLYTGGDLPSNINRINNLLYKKYVPNSKILIWKNMLTTIVDINTSDPIYNMKSLMYDTLFDIPTEYMKKITVDSSGLFSQYGMIQLLEELELYITDELIDRISTNMMLIIKNLMTNVNVISGLNQMLGIGYIEDFIKPGMIKPYILEVCKNKSLYLPLEFFFKEPMNAIPLISCMYSDITIRVRNSPYNLIKNYYKNNYILNNKKGISASMIFNYIILERTERKRLSLNKQDNLIDKHNYYSISQTITTQLDTMDNLMFVNFDFNINGLIKELFWTVEFFINGYLIENQNFTSQSIYTLILSTVIYIDGIKRDGILPIGANTINALNSSFGTPNNNINSFNYSALTRLVNPYKYNTRVEANNNVNVYSFSFEPEKFQPTGTINMDMYNTLRIQLILDKNKFIKYFGNVNTITNLDTVTIKMNLSTLEYNLVRYQSGLAGLLFMK